LIGSISPKVTEKGQAFGKGLSEILLKLFVQKA
jgi:hypothetical protein